MKTIIVEKDADGFVKTTADEIKKLVDEVYAAGYEDGRKSVSISSANPQPLTIQSLDPDMINKC